MPVKHFVTFETKDLSQKEEDQLKLLWNVVYWTEGEDLKWKEEDGITLMMVMDVLKTADDVGLFGLGNQMKTSGIVKAS